MLNGRPFVPADADREKWNNLPARPELEQLYDEALRRQRVAEESSGVDSRSTVAVLLECVDLGLPMGRDTTSPIPRMYYDAAMSFVELSRRMTECCDEVGIGSFELMCSVCDRP